MTDCRYLFQAIIIGLSLLLFSGCGGHLYHKVEQGESLYSIGWVYGYDYRQLAQWNHISPPYHLSPGQRLRVAPPTGYRSTSLQEYQPANSKNKKPRLAPVVVSENGKPLKGRVVVDDNSSIAVNNATNSAKSRVNAVVSATKNIFRSQKLVWHWPTEERRLLRTFSSKDPARQGLDIAGKEGSPIYAAAAGKVVYAGSGLARYGRLIIVKHNEKYLSAYAHNKKIHVKEGEIVRSGQRIADMGSTGKHNHKKRSKLHFEIRRNGKPVDPKHFLPR